MIRNDKTGEVIITEDIAYFRKHSTAERFKEIQTREKEKERDITFSISYQYGKIKYV